MHDVIEREAYKLGAEHARNAALWVTVERPDPDGIRRLISMIEDGDPEAWDYLPAMPNLSGEWADDPTPLSLARDLTSEDDPSSELQEMLTESYEEGVRDTFVLECERHLHKMLGPDPDIDYSSAYQDLALPGVVYRIVRPYDSEHVIGIMVGDDAEHVLHVDDLHQVKEGDYCPECGQVGCTGWKNTEYKVPSTYSDKKE